MAGLGGAGCSGEITTGTTGPRRSWPGRRIAQPTQSGTSRSAWRIRSHTPERRRTAVGLTKATTARFSRLVDDVIAAPPQSVELLQAPTLGWVGGRLTLRPFT